jgi:hypothetical protein
MYLVVFLLEELVKYQITREHIRRREYSYRKLPVTEGQRSQIQWWADFLVRLRFEFLRATLYTNKTCGFQRRPIIAVGVRRLIWPLEFLISPCQRERILAYYTLRQRKDFGRCLSWNLGERRARLERVQKYHSYEGSAGRL